MDINTTAKRFEEYKNNDTIKKWKEIHFKVLKKLEENPEWTRDIQDIFKQYGHIQNINTLKSEDFQKIWFSNNNIAHVSYFIENKIDTHPDIYRRATELLICSEGDFGKSLSDCKSFLNKNLNFPIKGGQIGNLIRTLLIVNDAKFTVVSVEVINKVLSYFNKPQMKMNEPKSITLAINSLNELTENIAIHEQISDYSKRKLIWLISQALDTNINTEPRNNIGSLNIMLYGPPGTGKTYKTKEKAIQIIEMKK